MPPSPRRGGREVLKRSPTSEPVRHPWNEKRRKWSRPNPEHLCHGGWNWTSDQPRLRVLRLFDHRWCLDSMRYQINSPLLVVAENNINFNVIAIEMMFGDNFIRMSNAWQWLASEVKTLVFFSATLVTYSNSQVKWYAGKDYRVSQGYWMLITSARHLKTCLCRWFTFRRNSFNLKSQVWEFYCESQMT